MLATKNRPDRGRDRRGAATVEMAVLLPLIVMLAFAMTEASRLCMVSQLLTNAAREGCRVAASNGNLSSDVTTRVDAALTAAKITPSLVTRTLSPSAIQGTTSSDQVALTLAVDFGKVNWLGTPFFFKSTTVTAKVVMQSERP